MQTHLSAENVFLHTFILYSHYLNNLFCLKNLIKLKSYYCELKGSVLHTSHPFATTSFNLHVLSILLAFILSQDQTHIKQI